MTLKTIFASALVCLLTLPTAQAALTVTGAGATFPYPLYSRWAEQYAREFNIQINYQSIGSGGGIKQIKANTVNFGASDKPLSADELKKNGLFQFPTVLGAVVPIVNLPNIKPDQLKLTGPILADIFLGKINNWSHPDLAKINPGLPLPNKKITVIHRSDGSGTTFLFTHYLSQISSEWAQKSGAETSVRWPTGLGGKGNEGVALFVKQMPGAIGYVEYSYAITNHLSHTQLQNKDNMFVSPSLASIQASAKDADWSESAAILTNKPGKDSWPISGATFILMHSTINETEKDKAAAVLDFFAWAYKNGGKDAVALQYVMLPETLIQSIQQQWQTQLKDEHGQPIWKK